MLQVGCGTFETNSSSTHSLVIATKDEYNKWADGVLTLDTHSNTFVAVPSESDLKEKYLSEIIKHYKLNMTSYHKNWDELTDSVRDSYIKEWLHDNACKEDPYRYKTKEEYRDNYLEGFYKEFHTPSGDHMVAFGQYGYDG